MLRVTKLKQGSVDNLHQSLHTSYILSSLASLLPMFWLRIQIHCGSPTQNCLAL